MRTGRTRFRSAWASPRRCGSRASASRRSNPAPRLPLSLSGADQATVDALRAGTALLVVLRGPNTGARFLLDADEVSSGRHPDSDIFLDDVTVSRKHASFRREGDRFLVRDVGSLNGTYVNRERIDEAALHDRRRGADRQVPAGVLRRHRHRAVSPGA